MQFKKKLIIVQLYRLVGRLSKSEIVNLFRYENVSKATIYRAIENMKTGRPHVLAQNPLLFPVEVG